MALPVFTIGAFSFTRFLSPMPEFPKHHFVTETRPGQDGFALIYTGRWGEPFTIDAESVFDTFANANAAVATYRDSPSLTPVNIVWDDLNMSTSLDVQYFIQNVEILSQKASVSVLRGAVHLAPAHVVMSRWTFLPRYVP